MKSSLSLLSKKSLLLLFAYAPAGLGHLRVTSALYHGLPSEASPLLLGSQDTTITAMHRLMSVHTITREIFEWLEQGNAEEITTPLYRWYLRSHTDLLYRQITTIIDQRIEMPEELLLIATHFGLAHQATAIKQKLITNRKMKVSIVVQVTDDSPHHIWYIPDADIIFVPSQRTKDRLEAYGRKSDLPPVNIVVNPYPLSPNLSTDLPESRMDHRKSQLNPHEDTTIHFAIPISGAAVGMHFVTHLVDHLHLKSSRFQFHVISKNAPFTYRFIYDMNSRPHVDVQSSPHDKKVIELYEDLYQNTTISLEVTKPSEQAFKALITPKKRGGAIMLFSNPVGRQEYDNLHFLQRNGLLPYKTIQKELWNFAKHDHVLDEGERKKIYKEAATWRALKLPDGSEDAAQFIWWCHQEKIFQTMLSCHILPNTNAESNFELRSDGVEELWEKTAQILTNNR